MSRTGKASNPMPKEFSAQKVIAIFSDALGLCVCDDAGMIKDKIKQKTDRFLRMKGQPDPAGQVQAEEWFKSVDLLANRRQELLDIVYELYRGLATVSLKAASEAQLKSLTAELESGLLSLGREQCRLDDALARRFLQRYMDENGLKAGGRLSEPGVIAEFKAEGRVGEASLSWSPLGPNCERIEIEREPAGAQAGGEFHGAPVYRGAGSSFVDPQLAPGRYRYRARAVYQDAYGPDAFAWAECMAEIKNPAAAWREGKLQLSWQLPFPGAAIRVYRKTGAPPALRAGPRGAQPVDASTKLVYSGTAEAWQDEDPAHGRDHHYRLIAVSSAGAEADGVDLLIAAPKKPSAPVSLEARHGHEAGKDTVTLRWTPAPGTGEAEYLVVRREGGSPPSSASDGKAVKTCAETECVDAGLAPGRRYCYAVFARAHGMQSPGANSAPVDVLSEVSGLDALPGDGVVELSWKSPPGARVVVRRSIQEPPRDAQDGQAVAMLGPDRARDTGLRNGARHHYRVCCGYRPDGKGEVFSAGLEISVAPVPLPDPVKDLSALSSGEEIVCKFTPPKSGELVLIRSERPLKLNPGARLKAKDLDQFGERMPVEAGKAVDASPDPSKPYYTAFTVSGPHAVAGNGAIGFLRPDVSGLDIVPTRDGVVLRWAWPEHCRAALILRSMGAAPPGIDEKGSGVKRMRCTREEYENAGGRFLDPAGEARGDFFYTVFARAAGAPGEVYSRGMARKVRLAPPMVLRYRLEPAGAAGREGDFLRLSWSVEEPVPGFSGFALYANRDAIPSSGSPGIALGSMKNPDLSQRDHIALVPLVPAQKKGWASFFCKLLPLDEEQGEGIVIVHPDVCIQFSSKGLPLAPKKGDPPRRYRSGTPKTVICPSCLEEFPMEKMLYTSWESEEMLPGVSSLADRMMGRAPRPPMNRHGQVLTRKVCPNEGHHDLPFTAGSQESLIIGLIGAKFSGKSHYIASLVKQLQGRVAGDMRAALMPVTDETSDRFKRDFEEPLWQDRAELQQTVGTPPPLVYDLTLDGSLWGEEQHRTVTLVLYDTAGENLDDPDRVREMLQYLRVASGVMFLIDPLQSQIIRQQLNPSVTMPQVDRMADPNTVISRVIKEMEGGKLLRDGNAPIHTPVAVVLTKCDVLRDEKILKANRLWSTDRRHVAHFDTELHDDISGMMGEHLRHISIASYNTIRMRFPNHAFFGVSATGCPLDKETNRYRQIAPWRVEDPLLWLLAMLGALPMGSGASGGR